VRLEFWGGRRDWDAESGGKERVGAFRQNSLNEERRRRGEGKAKGKAVFLGSSLEKKKRIRKSISFKRRATIHVLKKDFGGSSFACGWPKG